jgi:AcrR family transcriptional regulator
MTERTVGRPRAFDRDAALDIVVRLFWERGYEATSMRDVTDALGIGAPSVYRAFGDKRALFAQALAAYDDGYGGFVNRALAEEPSARAAAARMLREGPAHYTRAGLPKGCLIANPGAPAADPARLVAQLRTRKAAALARRIRADVRAGALPAGTDATALARFTLATLTGLAQSARDGARRAELKRVAELALSAWPGG